MIGIRWYGVMYVVAFWLAWAIVPRLGKIRGITLSRDQWTRIIAWGAFGVLVGGRLGYAILYDPAYFIANPFEIFKIWHGGMSSHGGFVGAALGVWFATRTSSPSLLLAIADILCIPAAVGLALGRIGNITNDEFGIYPQYEAVGDVIIAVVCLTLLYAPHTNPLPERERGTTRGKIFAIFLILYSILRFLLEYVRPQEWSYIFGLTRGQAYTIPILIIGVILWRYADKQ